MWVDFTIFDVYYPWFIKNINDKINVKFINEKFLGVLKEFLKLFGNRNVFKKSLWVVNWNEFY